MSYITRGERIFKLPDCRYINCSPPSVRRSDHRLKRYLSATDKRAWACDEAERYQHLYELMTGSRTCLVPTSSLHPYVPLEALIDILLAEKIAYIKKLEDKLRELGALGELEMTYITESESYPTGIMSTAIPTIIEMTPSAPPASFVDDKPGFLAKEEHTPTTSSYAIAAKSEMTPTAPPASIVCLETGYSVEAESPPHSPALLSPTSSSQKGSQTGSAKTYLIAGSAKSGVTPTDSWKSRTPVDSRSESRRTSTSRKESLVPSVTSSGSPSRKGSLAPSVKSAGTPIRKESLAPSVKSTGSPIRKEALVPSVKSAGSPSSSPRKGSPTGSEKKVASLYVSKAFEESDEEKEKETDISSMRSTIGILQAELTSNRDLLHQAMHKLENIDEIMGENTSLRDKLRCSEETIRRLEEKKKDLEKELEKLRSSSDIQKDLNRAQEELAAIQDQENDDQGNESNLRMLASERDTLLLEVKELQEELSQAKKCKDELELLKKQSESASLNLEEISRENECYKKKLEAMKCLEKQIAELKKQATALGDKYKRESSKANDQINQLTNTAREVKMLHEERERLNKRIEELSKYEKDYRCLETKLGQVDSILAENECLNSKLCELDELEIENQELRCKIQELKCKEVDSEENKTHISQLQDAIADQEEEMKALLNQIEQLTRDKTAETEEILRLKAEIDEKNERLKLCEQQLSEIPLLEAEIEELKNKMLKCYETLSPDTDSIKRLHQEVEMQRKKFRRNDAFSDGSQVPCSSDCEEDIDGGALSEKNDPEKELNCEQIHKLLQSTKNIISSLLGDMREHQREMEEMEEANRMVKDELEMLKSLGEKSDSSDLIHRINQLKQCIKLKDKEICELRQLNCANKNMEDIKRRIAQYENDLAKMNEMNRQLKEELDEAGLSLAKVSELEEMLKTERKARSFSEELAKDLEEKLEKETNVQKVKEDLIKLKKQEENLAIRESFSSFTREIQDLKEQILKLKELVEELKNENGLLRELQNPGPDFAKELEEKLELEELLTKCQTELETIRGQHLTDECNALREQLKRLMTENDHYKKQTKCYKETLECERRAKSMLEAQIDKFQASTSKSSPCDKILSNAKAQRVSLTLDECIRERDCWKCEAQTLKNRNKCLQDQVRKLCAKIDKKDETSEELWKLRRESEDSQRKIGELEKNLKKSKKECESIREKVHRLSSEREVLVSRLRESQHGVREEMEEYKKSLADKHAMEKAMRGVENEMNKLEEKKKKTVGIAKDDVKVVKDLENEIDVLRKKLAECQKTEAEVKKERDSLLNMGPEELRKARVEAAKKKEDSEIADKQKDIETLKKQLENCRKREEELENIKKEKKNLLTSASQTEQAIAAEEKKKKLLSSGSQTEQAIAAEEKKKKLLSSGSQTEQAIAGEEKKKKLLSSGSQTEQAVADEKKKKVATSASQTDQAKVMEDMKKLDVAKKFGEAKTLEEAKKFEQKRTEEISKMKEKEREVAEAGKKAEECKNCEKLEDELDNLKKLLGIPDERRKDFTGAKEDIKGPKKEGAALPTSKEGTKKEGSSLLDEIPSVEDSIAWSLGSAEKNKKGKPIETPSTQDDDSKPKQATPAYPKLEATSGLETESSELLLTSDNCDALLREVQALRGQLATSQNEINRLKNENIKLQQDPCLIPSDSFISFSDVDPDFEKFKGSMCKEDYKRNITEIEKRFKIQTQRLEEAHATKIKKLLIQNEKESQKKDKLFNSNLNSMRNNYESDIKKLAEKHKASILRLQSLHEDEIREVNTNYETQMEAMQKQNENVINDLTRGAKSKFKELVEQHNHDIQALERKFRQVLEEKETEHMYEISNLQAKLTQNMDEVEEYQKRTMETVTVALEGNIAEMQSKHQCELKKLKKSHSKKVDMMKRKYDELLMEQRKKYEEQLEAAIRKGDGDGCGCECTFAGFVPKKATDPKAPLEFYKVVRKIIDEGLEALNFNELALMHRNTCCATEDKLLDPDLHPELEPAIGSTCPQSALMAADKEHLFRRICVLENEIKAKQMETHETIINLERALRAERIRLESVKKALYDEQEMNSELKNLLSNQTRNKTNLEIERNFLSRQASLHENQVLEKVRELEKERDYGRTLEEENRKLRMNIQIITSALNDSDKRNYSRRDTDYIPTKQKR